MKISPADKPNWVISKKVVYTSAETWNAIHTKHAEVNWWRLVWFPLAIPRHAFIL
jgi:hypothetical protein